MPAFEASTRTTLVTATALAPLAAFRAATAQRARIREIGIFTVTAPTTVGGIGLMRSTALGTGALTSAVGINREPGDSVTTGQIVSAWATAAPTVGAAATVFRRASFPASVGQGVIWTWDIVDPLLVPLGNTATGELVFVNLNATAPGTYDIYVTWEE